MDGTGDYVAIGSPNANSDAGQVQVIKTSVILGRKKEMILKVLQMITQDVKLQ